jgi:hypothetical protein
MAKSRIFRGPPIRRPIGLGPPMPRVMPMGAGGGPLGPPVVAAPTLPRRAAVAARRRPKKRGGY